jgi:hypothetical protein
MYGLITKINTVSGQRDALATILLEGTKAMPGCRSYVIASDPADDKALCVQTAVAKGRSMIVGFSSRVETVPIGGHGIERVGTI